MNRQPSIHSAPDRAKAVLRKIAYQVPETRKAHLVFAVFAQAVRDCYGSRNGLYGREARKYLSRHPITHLDILGIDTDWARDQFAKANLEIMK